MFNVFSMRDTAGAGEDDRLRADAVKQRTSQNAMNQEWATEDREYQLGQREQADEMQQIQLLHGASQQMLELAQKDPEQYQRVLPQVLGDFQKNGIIPDANVAEFDPQEWADIYEMTAAKLGGVQPEQRRVVRSWPNPQTGTMWALDDTGEAFDTGAKAQQFANRPLETGGGTAPFNPATGTAGNIIPGTEPEAMAGREATIKAATTEAEARAKADFESENSRAQNIMANRARINDIDSTIGNIDGAIGLANWWSAGPTAQIMSNLGATDARALKAALEPIKAALAFDRLQQMRDASKTGGALGQVSERELDLLMGAVQSLDQAQEPEAIINNLKRVRTHYERTKRLIIGQEALANGTPFAATPAEARKLAPGTLFVNPDGRVMRVPGG